ncbi:hypothetical protein JTB14_036237 [Gonioctena quinquepunctata]|nr:hypothetical protein JTB14_036237 [Gonioctena quinquepunctata]
MAVCLSQSASGYQTSPEPTSLARAMGFNRRSVEQFFLLLAEMMEKPKIPPERIYNVDETGIMTVPKKRSKCLSLCGNQQGGCWSSAERGVCVTVEICMGAGGVHATIVRLPKS